ncbi:hypothetical protein [Nocardioides endophyticus]|uniref:hypothetical protein n=1 Tax=Nocardioides endophyticus TaxID=1353775 RepID=UPI0031EA8E32
MRRLKTYLPAWRERPVLAIMVAGFITAWALRIPAQHGSTWDSILAGAAWILLICCAVVGLVGGRPSNSPS